MVMYALCHELTDDIIHIGTKEECELILNAMETYGIRRDKFYITTK